LSKKYPWATAAAAGRSPGQSLDEPRSKIMRKRGHADFDRPPVQQDFKARDLFSVSPGRSGTGSL
jgi:hypothetical protein